MLRVDRGRPTHLRGSMGPLLPVMVVGVWAILAPPAGAAKAPKKIDPDAPCSSEKCHPKIADFKHAHDPATEGDCRECHQSEANDKHAFKMGPVPATCYGCHDPVNEAPNVHAPAEDECLECHAPHGSNTVGMLRAQNQMDLCFGCHDNFLDGKKYAHGPAGGGACTMCHDPHRANSKQMTRKLGMDLCAECHSEMVETVKSARYVHGPVKKGCTTCHNPHASDFPRMLPKPTGDICTECHAKIVEGAQKATVPHPPAKNADGRCVGCHAVHASDSAPNLLLPQKQLCLKCHGAKSLDRGHMKVDMVKLFKNNPDEHGPIREGNCAGCHQPHGSDNYRLLKQPYPARFYSPFNPESYELCFTCHESSVVTEARTRTLTGFRDGSRNLHFLHVNRKKRGRTCRACHEVHASKLPRHIRESVPYGKWLMPIKFKKSKNGGFCQPGCHPAVTYDRLKEDKE